MQAMKRRFGKLPAVHSPRTPRLSAHLSAALPQPPASCDWSAGVSAFPLWRNGDQLGTHGTTIPGLGDCTAVSVASAIACMHRGTIMLTDDEVVGIYAANGYDPARPATDQGAAEVDVLNRWCETGYEIGRQAPDVLTAYGFVDPRDRNSVRRAIAMLGGLYVGLSLPGYVLSARGGWVIEPGDQTPAGGHAVFLHGFDADWLYLNSWGERVVLAWDAFSTWCDEAYGLLHRGWLDTHGTSPMGEVFDAVTREFLAVRA